LRQVIVKITWNVASYPRVKIETEVVYATNWIEKCAYLSTRLIGIVLIDQRTMNSRTIMHLILELESRDWSVHTRSTLCHIPEDSILHSHRCENLKSYVS
jgi:hypothetical protein